MNIENLQKLADYLRSGKLPYKFNMAALNIEFNGHITHPTNRKEIILNADKSKISVCAMGAGMVLFDVYHSEDLDKLLGLDGYRDKGAYVRHTCWANDPLENTPEAAAKRIEDVIHGTMDLDKFNRLRYKL